MKLAKKIAPYLKNNYYLWAIVTILLHPLWFAYVLKNCFGAFIEEARGAHWYYPITKKSYQEFLNRRRHD